eukprot:CAMPEP_0176288932 /NCGR_PEP_ID=MMETSP0121_2-20121125/54233_1 /TAXON_ID=160619 /ORGANISM="Kryptoperidinium foliaceum, Strain CCMP 1326" /LENGTH=46 /DNA_ID= /DNA_START= /DNA_END= /DNA_ORIENTATION=
MKADEVPQSEEAERNEGGRRRWEAVYSRERTVESQGRTSLERTLRG